MLSQFAFVFGEKMSKSKRFLRCLELQNEALLISFLCSLSDIFYATTFVSLYKFVRITKHVKDMETLNKVKALAISVAINFVVYHFVSSVLMAVGVRKVKFLR